MNNQYDIFSQFYDELTKNVDYTKIADYLLSLLNRYHHESGITLDLACGTGSLTVELKKRGLDVYGIDSSPEMLMYAREKSYDLDLDILFLCQKMQSIDLYGTIDTCFCTLDSINHLKDISQVRETFAKVSLFLNKGGLFIFDMNTIYKHREILCNNTYIYDTENVYCVWQNRLKSDNLTVNVNLDFFYKTHDKKYLRQQINFNEKAYNRDEILNALENVGLEVLDIFDEYTFEYSTKKTQREFFITRKI